MLLMSFLAVNSLGLSGCAPIEPIPVPPEDVFAAALDAVALDPNTTCEELRRMFGLDGLKVVENPGQAGIPFEEQFVPTPDGQSLRVWSIPAKANRGTILYSSGAVGEVACYLYPVVLLNQAGWSVVMYDYRGFGGSSGEPSLATLATDLETVLDWTLEHTGVERVTLLGISLGSIPSVNVASRRPEALNALILDSPISLTEQVRRLRPALLENTDAFVNLIDPALQTEALMPQVHAPVLVLIGQFDFLAKPEVAGRLFELAGPPRRLVLFPGLGHVRAPFDAEADYVAAVDSFLAFVWEGAAWAPAPGGAVVVSDP